jgi:hypothetical protein
MPRTTLDRPQYASLTRSLLPRAFSPDTVARVLAYQYPKPADLASAELRCRGAACEALPADRCWSASELDLLVDSAELTGALTGEGHAAQQCGLSLVEFRKRHPRPTQTVNWAATGLKPPTMNLPGATATWSE